MKRVDDERVVERWKHISELVLCSRAARRAVESNAALEHCINEDPKGPIAPAMAAWRANNFLFDGYFEKGARELHAVAKRHEKHRFRGVSWAAHALDRAAYCHEQCGEPDKALKALSAILEVKDHGPDVRVHYERGRVLEAASRDADAIDAYREAARRRGKPSLTDEELPDLARRAAERLSSAEKLEPFPDRLAERLARALRRRDAAALEALASKTHFGVGVEGGETTFIDYAKVARRIKDDLARADLRVDPAGLLGKGEKLYLYTDDWRGDFLRGRVCFQLARFRDGWQWTGLSVTQTTEGHLDVPPVARPPVPHDSKLPIKAPFPRGVCFRAGGARRYLSSLVPFFGSLIVAEDAVSRCGYGPGGFYYNEANHNDRSVYAIDFARYRRGFPNWNGSGGIPALAVQWGIAGDRYDKTASDGWGASNWVLVEHPSPDEAFAVLFGIDLPGTLKYLSRYVHLAGPRAILPCPGMYVRQGAQLGLINNTGTKSLWNHLHFSLHDRDLGDGGNHSVRPTPMDGHTLGDGDHGKCVCSSNVQFP